MVRSVNKSIAIKDLLSSQPPEILDSICYHVPNQQLKYLACMNEALFVAATRSLWSRNSVNLGDRVYKDLPGYFPYEYRHKKSSVGEWENASHDEFSRAKTARAQKVERPQNGDEIVRQRGFIRLGPFTVATHDHRVFYARQTRLLEVRSFGVGARYTRDLMALLSEVKFPGLEVLAIKFPQDYEDPPAPRLIQLHLSKLVFDLITWRTTKLELHCRISDLNLLYTICPMPPQPTNIKDLQIVAPPDFDLCAALVERMPHLERFTQFRLISGSASLGDKAIFGLGRLVESLSKRTNLDLVSIDSYLGRLLPWESGDLKLGAKRIDFMDFDSQFLHDLCLRIDAEVLKEIRLRVYCQYWDIFADLALLNESSGNSNLTSLVVQLRHTSLDPSAASQTIKLNPSPFLQFIQNNQRIEHLEVAGKRSFVDMSGMTLSVYTTLATTLSNLKHLQLTANWFTCHGDSNSLIALGLHCRMIENIEADLKWDITTTEFRSHVEVQKCLDGGEVLFPSLRKLVMRCAPPTELEQADLRQQAAAGVRNVASEVEIEQFRHMVSVAFPSLSWLTRFGVTEGRVSVDFGLEDEVDYFWNLRRFITPYFWRQFENCW